MNDTVLASASHLFPYFDWGATFLWAASGAMLGARRGYDWMGAFAIALVSAAGGGLLRDGIFLQSGPPVVVQSPVYLGLIAAATLAVALFGGYLKTSRWFDTIVTTTDAVGLGAYAVVGMNLAIAANLSVFGVVCVGVVNAVGGSVLRDVLMGAHPPELFRPGVPLGLASLAGCILYMLLVHWQANTALAGIAAVVVVFTIRVVALRFGLKTRPLRAFKDDWRAGGTDGA